MEQEREQQRPPQQLFSGMMPTGLAPPPQKATGMTRAIAFVQGLSGKAVVLAGVVFGLQAVMGEGSKPSDLIGSFHGKTTAAQYDAEREAHSKTAEALANAQAKAAAQWAIEQETARQQLEAITRSLAMKQEAANLADLACMSGGVATAMFGRDAAQYAQVASTACDKAAQLRAEIVAAQGEAARIGSALMQRPAPMPVYAAAPTAAPPR